MGLRLQIAPGRFAICRLAPDAPPPMAQLGDGWYAIARTGEELSVVCPSDRSLACEKREEGFRLLRVAGKLDFSEIGVLASLAGPLAEAEISILAISTFDTDYLLVREADLDHAVEALCAVGHSVHPISSGGSF